MGLCAQLRALIWKNWLVQKRKKVYTVLMVLYPLIYYLLILFIKRKAFAPEYPSIYEERNIRGPWGSPQNKIYYFPSTSETDLVMDLVMNVSAAKHQKLFVQGFKSEEEALKQQQDHSNEVPIVLEFKEVTASQTVLPQNLKLTVRPVTGKDDKWETGRVFPEKPGYINPAYNSSGVLFFQGLVGQAVVKYWLSKDNKQSKLVNFEINTQRMADLSLSTIGEASYMRYSFPPLCYFLFLITVISMTRNMAREKGNNIKESMKLMGLDPLVYWLSWVVTHTIYLLPILLLFFLLVSNLVSSAPIILHSSSGLVFFFLLFFVWALIAFSFMVTSFVDKESTGTVLCVILYFVFLIMYYFVESQSFLVKLVGCLFFGVSMAFGSSAIGRWEQEGVGAQWSNFYSSPLLDDNLTLLECMVLLLLDSAIYLTIYWYLDSVKPGQYGIPKPYNFCLLVRFLMLC